MFVSDPVDFIWAPLANIFETKLQLSRLYSSAYFEAPKQLLEKLSTLFTLKIAVNHSFVQFQSRKAHSELFMAQKLDFGRKVADFLPFLLRIAKLTPKLDSELPNVVRARFLMFSRLENPSRPHGGLSVACSARFFLGKKWSILGHFVTRKKKRPNFHRKRSRVTDSIIP